MVWLRILQAAGLWMLVSCVSGTNNLVEEAKQERSVQKALELTKSSDKRVRAGGHYVLAYLYDLDSADFEKSLFHEIVSLRLYSELGATKEISRSYNNLAELLRFNGDYREAIGFYDKALETAPSEYLYHKRSIYKAAVLIELNELGSATKILLECREFFEDYGNDYWLAEVYLFIGNTESAYARITETAEGFKNSIGYYQSARELYQDSISIAKTILNTGNNLMRLGDYDQALPALLESTDILSRYEDPNLYIAYNDLGELYFRTERYDSARDYFVKSIVPNRMTFELKNSFQKIKDSYIIAGDYSKADSVTNLFFGISGQLLQAKNEARIRNNTLLKEVYESEFIAEQRRLEYRRLVIINIAVGLALIILASIAYRWVRKRFDKNFIAITHEGKVIKYRSERL